MNFLPNRSSLALFAALSLLAAGSVHADTLYSTTDTPVLGVFGYDLTSSEPVSPTTISTGYSYPTGIAVDPAGNLYVADYVAGTISKITPGGSRTLFSNDGSIAATEGLLVHNGYLYASASNNIERFNLSTGVESLYGTSGDTNIGMAFNSAGSLYLANETLNQIVIIAPGGGAASLFSTSNLINPTGLAFDSLGNLFVANYDSSGTGSIVEFANVGGTLSSTSTLFASDVNNPIGLAIDSQNNVYVTTAGGNEVIYKYDPEGNRSIFASGVNGQSLVILVPEPSTWAMLGLGVVALGLLRRRQRA